MNRRIRHWWSGFAVALFLLLPADLLTTLLTVATYGTAVEANPVMRWLLRQGLLELTLVHLAVLAVSVCSFHVVTEAVRDAPDAYRAPLVCGVDAWLTLAVAVGVALVANNLVVAL